MVDLQNGGIEAYAAMQEVQSVLDLTPCQNCRNAAFCFGDYKVDVLIDAYFFCNFIKEILVMLINDHFHYFSVILGSS